jgi:hypothetical protein
LRVSFEKPATVAARRIAAATLLDLPSRMLRTRVQTQHSNSGLLAKSSTCLNNRDHFKYPDVLE